MIAAEDLKPGLYVAIRYARQHPLDSEWAHVATPAVYRVLSVALPYAALECLASGRRFPADLSVFELEHLRPEFVATLFPDAAARRESPQPADERDERGYPKPQVLMTIKAPGHR